MKNENLEKAVDEILKALDNSDIDRIDKTELIINLNYFLNKDDYRKNVKILSKQMEKNKWKNK